MSAIKKTFDYKGVPILASLFLVLFFAEGRRQLRKRVQQRSKRVLINSIVSVPGFSLMRLLVLPVMYRIAVKNKVSRIGAIYYFCLPDWVKQAIAFLIMDYTNYWWHLLNHKLPVLWRFHIVHHTDLDLDVTTALRFHFGEMIGSLFFRSAFVFLSGASPLTVLIYEIIFEGATEFHHSNMKLPYRLEKVLNAIIVTPRMHSIHHSIITKETDNNYSVIFSVWDRLHKTARLNVHQGDIIIGVPAYRNADELSAGRLLKMPFYKIKTIDEACQIPSSEKLISGKNNLAK